MVVAAEFVNRIERREYKYWITEAEADGIRRWIRPFCKLDENAASRSHQRYTIDSLYLDTPSWACYVANEHERPDRFKLRIRTYPDADDPPVFFEVKRRINDVIAKDRAGVPGDWAALLTEPGRLPPDSLKPVKRAAVERFMALAIGNHAMPRVIVRYEREPWMSTIDQYARVTFDRHIRSLRADRFAFEYEAADWRAADHALTGPSTWSPTVLELKFTRDLPIWLSHLVSHFNLHRRAFSKYGHSIRAWYGPRWSDRVAVDRRPGFEG